MDEKLEEIYKILINQMPSSGELYEAAHPDYAITCLDCTRHLIDIGIMCDEILKDIEDLPSTPENYDRLEVLKEYRRLTTLLIHSLKPDYENRVADGNKLMLAGEYSSSAIKSYEHFRGNKRKSIDSSEKYSTIPKEEEKNISDVIESLNKLGSSEKMLNDLTRQLEDIRKENRDKRNADLSLFWSQRKGI